ncbi:DUF2442 domain-containing protein [Oricola sp.]|uniref:DUF2442 domain-containing protein n=1 Tax=Oricola sp. TaxID=1979950 RepID=UPI003BA9FA31
MIDIVKVTGVEPREGHALFVRFSTGEEGEADFSWVLDGVGAMAAPLGDPAYLAGAFLSNGVLTWPNGFDVDSIALYREMAAQGRLRQSAA